MTDHDIQGRRARELSGKELEQQGTQAHATRNWVFLHGSDEQFGRHTTRMPELEREYVSRFPKRTWQGSGAANDPAATAEAWRETVRGVTRQLETLVELSDAAPAPTEDPQITFLKCIADTPGGRLHKLEAHQAAREVGLDRAAVARLYNAQPPPLATELQGHVITVASQARLAEASA